MQGTRPVLGAGAPGAVVQEGREGCLRSWWSWSVPLPPAVECEAWTGRYFGCTWSPPRPLESDPAHSMP